MSFDFPRQFGKLRHVSDKQVDASIGRNLQKIRTDANSTQGELAKAMRARGYKWSKTTVWSIETGERPLKLAEAQDLLECLDYDWITYLPILLQGEGTPATELEIKAKLLETRYNAVQAMVPELAKAYFDYLLSGIATFNKHGDDVGKDDLQERLDECCPESLNSYYWGYLKNRLREYCMEKQNEEKTVGDSESKGYDAEWRRVFNLLGDEWRKYLFPDDYYASNDLE